MNKVILMGRLTNDPMITTAGELTVAKFSIAVDRKFKREGAPTADFPHCVAFGKTANFCRDYLKRGTKVCAEGRLQTGSYTNKDGDTVYTTDVIIESIEFAESKSAGQSAAGTPVSNNPPENTEPDENSLPY